MDAVTRLIILKKDLDMLSSAKDDYLKILLELAERRMAIRGIQKVETIEYDMALIQYAAYLFRRRSDPTAKMSPSLKLALNEILFSQKMGD